MPNIKETSEEELRQILAYLAQKTIGDHPPVLVGGWAVYSYNPYEKSTDIDLVLNARRRSDLLQWLRAERGYTAAKKVEHGWQGAAKYVPGVGEMIVDIAGYEEAHRFEGRSDRLDFRLVRDHHTVHDVGGSLVRVPTRSLLVLFKAKAIHDRGHRLDHGTSHDRTWEQAKRTKDRADILAFLDAPNETDWEVGFLGRELSRLPFLIEFLRTAPRDKDAVVRYGQQGERAAQQAMDDLLSTVI